MKRLLLTLLFCVVQSDTGHAKVGFRQLTVIHPVAVQRGTEHEVRLRSNFTLDGAYATFFDRPGITMTLLETEPIDSPRKNRASVGTPFRFNVEVPQDQPTGVYELRVATPQAVSSISHLLVTDYPVVVETADSNDSPEAAQEVSIPAAVCGICEKNEDVDCYRFSGAAGQRITAQVYAQRTTECIHIMLVKHPVYHMNPILALIGPSGQIVAENDNFYGGDSFIHCELPEDGEYTVQIRDVRFAGSEKFTYCIELSDRPFLKSMFPLAVQQGTTVEAVPVGYGFDGAPPVELAAGDDRADVWNPTRFESADGVSNEVPVLTSSLPQYVIGEGSDSLESATPIELPCGISGRVAQPDGAQFFAFDAVKGRRYRFEVEADRLGLPLDSVIEIFNSDGALLAEADDTRGSPFAGFYVAKDSVLDFKSPEDGTFYVSVRDLNGGGGEHYVYYLRAEPSGPDFELYGEYYYAMLAPGTRMLWFTKLNRLNGFDGPVEIGIEGLPDGVTMLPATIPAGMDHCALILEADDNVKIDASLVRLFGKASVALPDGSSQEITHNANVTCELQQGGGSAQIRWPCKTQIVGITQPLDLVSVEASPVQINMQPGGRAEIKVNIIRKEGNVDPVSLAMSHLYVTNSSGDQLPPGVTLSKDSRTQLKGDETEATIILEAAKDALPVKDLTIAVMARVYVTYNISTNYASTPISLTVGSAE
ncbi:MAG: PPC domain-containing protein [Planctomycetaceae bacterium]|nr:PPC domain-containing protein [Planctomycetaceae bacterium]